ncbi:MAG: type II toxin-antitoxin system YoeB family toxin [Bacteroidales bacterium]|nr:type II toxin-antitoxin system YoeB family toxin [Bacteroidales bacterium]
MKDIKRTPFEGKGKPEPLKYDLAGLWSRRIDLELKANPP